jgi:hypothetical protein
VLSTEKHPKSTITTLINDTLGHCRTAPHWRKKDAAKRRDPGRDHRGGVSSSPQSAGRLIPVLPSEGELMPASVIFNRKYGYFWLFYLDTPGSHGIFYCLARRGASI